jgi:putative N6-adenine-specific DNA methylase
VKKLEKEKFNLKNEKTENDHNFTFVAFCTAGLEGAVAVELKKYNYKIVYSSSGRIFFNARLNDIPFLNMVLKTPDRIALLVKQFKTETFDELYENIFTSNARDLIEKDAKITIEKVKVTNSKLSATGAIASVVKKAIIDNIHGSDERKAEYPFLVILKDDITYLLLDTTGKSGMHKRGYRLKSSIAPLRETIAASLIILSRWNENIPLFDPFCGSGTIPIEASILNIPNTSRTYVSESWAILKNIWQKAKQKAMQEVKYQVINSEKKELIFASDRDCKVLKTAQENYQMVKKLFPGSAHINFRCLDFRNLPSYHEKAYVISNLPYGKRLDSDILNEISVLKSKFPNGNFYLLHPSDKFEKYFGKATKKFKLQNSGIWTYLHMYY